MDTPHRSGWLSVAMAWCALMKEAASRAGEEVMRGFRLNSWQRVGIVLSVLWVIVEEVASFSQRVVFDPVRAGYSKCISLGVGPSICKAELDKGRPAKRAATRRNWCICPRSDLSRLATHLRDCVDRALDQAGPSRALN